MGTLYVTEFCNVGITGVGTPTQVAAQSPTAEQTVSFTTTTQSSAFQNNTQLVRIHNDGTAPCSIAFGTNPTATTGKCRMAANQTEYFTVPLGLAYKVAAITNT